MKPINTQKQVDAAERTLRLSWVIVTGAVLFSVLTVTPLVERVTPDRWDWTAPILPIVVDTAVVIVVRIDAIIARLGGRPGGWSAFLRWLTGGMTLLLNIGNSALRSDLVGVGVHMVAPTLLIVTAEASLTYRRAIMTAVERIEHEREQADREREREQREKAERSRADRERDQEQERAERERQRAADERDREQERADREREREHAAQVAREEREHAARLEREREERADARAAAERDDAARQQREETERQDRLRSEQRERDERERKAREVREQADRDRKTAVRPKVAAAAVSTPTRAVSATVSTARPAVSTTAHDAPEDDKMGEAQALREVAAAVREGRSQRQVAALTGWSTGWVAKKWRECEQVPGQLDLVPATG